MVNEQKVRENILRMIEAVNARDVDMIDRLADEFYAADYVYHHPGE
jgi:hypothetical protein